MKRPVAAGEPHAHLNLALIHEGLGAGPEAEQHFRAGVTAGDSRCAVTFAKYLAADERRADLVALLSEVEAARFSTDIVREVAEALESLGY
jgi:hypothetical protein